MLLRHWNVGEVILGEGVQPMVEWETDPSLLVVTQARWGLQIQGRFSNGARAVREDDGQC